MFVSNQKAKPNFLIEIRVDHAETSA